MRRPALIGKKFGRLTVVSFAGRYLGYDCICDCGNKTIARGWALKTGRHQSCGCLVKERMRARTLPNFQSLKNDIYRNYKTSAKRRKYEFLLTQEEFDRLTQENCYYCGTKPLMTYTWEGKKKEHEDFRYNGIDRKDNAKGYTVENSVSCCRICNNSKNILTQEEWFEWIKRIYEFQKL